MSNIKQPPAKLGWRGRLNKITEIIRVVNALWDMEIVTSSSAVSAKVERGAGRIVLVIPDVDEKIRRHVREYHSS